MLFQKSSGGVQWIVVGLGNPGKDYESTRHNMGFLAVDGLAQKESFKFNKLRFKAWTAQWKCGNENVLVMKPQTYMNLSGEAVGEAARFYKISPDHVLVISDDMDLPVGKIRIRASGSAGGHNGLKSIIAHLHSEDFIRIKIGVGRASGNDHDDVVDHVIGKPVGEEQKILITSLDKTVDAIPMIIKDGIQKAMGKYN